MRITTQMLNETAKKGGLDLNRPTLLDYLNKDSNNTLLKALSESKQKSSDMLKKNNYEKVSESSGNLTKTAKRLADNGEESLFGMAKSDNIYEKIYDAIYELIEEYNNTIDNSKYLTGTLDVFYNNKLKEIAEENSEALCNVGITVAKDGKMELEKNKLKSADIEALEKIFGNDSDFTTKLAYVASKLNDNAEANIESLSNVYNSDGNSYTATINRYNILG